MDFGQLAGVMHSRRRLRYPSCAYWTDRKWLLDSTVVKCPGYQGVCESSASHIRGRILKRPPANIRQVREVVVMCVCCVLASCICEQSELSRM